MTWNPESYGIVTFAEPKPHREAIRQHRISPQGIASLPGFAESLRLLLVEEEYTLEDVGQMFGVTRERIRQIANKLGITTRAMNGGLKSVRLWQDNEHRFRPVHKSVIKRVATYDRVTKRHKTVTDKHAERWAKAVATLRDLARITERTPTLRDLSRALGLSRNVGTLNAHLLGYTRKGTVRTLAPLYADAGLTIRERGKGRTRHRPPSDTCRRGHPRTPGTQRCVVCQRARDRARYAAKKRRPA